MQFRLELRFGAAWVRLPGLYPDRDTAHWLAATWRQEYCRPGADPIRLVEVVATAGLIRQDRPGDVTDLLTVDEALTDPAAFVAGMEEV